MRIFRYGHAELSHLKSRDRKLAAAIDRIGMVEARSSPTSRLWSSHRGATDIERRGRHRLGPDEATLREITPERLDAATLEEVQQCGLSFRKAGYIKESSRAVAEGEVDLEALGDLPTPR